MQSRTQPTPRIGVVAACQFPAPRGSQVLIDEMATALYRAGADTHLVAPIAAGLERPYAVHSIGSRRADATARLPRGGGRVARTLLDVALAARLFAVTRRARLEVLHAHNYEGLLAALLARRSSRVPVVYHSHNVAADELPHYVGARARATARRIGGWLDASLPRRADQVVALSTDVAAHLAGRGVAAERLVVIPPGIDPAPFAACRAAPGARRAVFAGNLDHYQNLGVLLDAFAIAASQDPAIALSLVTHAGRRGLDRAVERRRLAGRIRVVVASSLAEVAGELSRATLGVSPRSSWSGFPIKTLNYMASAMPTVALTGSAKGVRHGETGWVVDGTAPAGLAEVLRAALGDPAACLRRGAAARQAVLEEHSWARLSPALLDVSRRAREAPR